MRAHAVTTAGMQTSGDCGDQWQLHAKTYQWRLWREQLHRLCETTQAVETAYWQYSCMVPHIAYEYEQNHHRNLWEYLELYSSLPVLKYSIQCTHTKWMQCTDHIFNSTQNKKWLSVWVELHWKASMQKKIGMDSITTFYTIDVGEVKYFC